MKFAIVNTLRQEAQPGLTGKCPACEHPMIAKCGDVRVRHWAHQGKVLCDRWWEPEGEWHRAWKAEFPDAWQEIVHRAEDGTKHIADVKTAQGWVIELQHSSIKVEERRARDAFYRQIVWVVDGTRLKRDAAQFDRAWNDGVRVGNADYVRRLYPDFCALLRKWADSHTPIFVDFGQPILWWILPGRPNGWVYVAMFPRDQFIHIHRSGGEQEILNFTRLVKDFGELVAKYENGPQPHSPNPAPLPPPLGFHPVVRRRWRL